MAALIPEGGSRWSPLPAALPSAAAPGHAWAAAGDPETFPRDRRAPSGSAGAQGTPEGAEGQAQGLSCRDGDPRANVGCSRVGERSPRCPRETRVGAVPSGGHGCGRAPLSAAISAAFPSAAAAAREPLFPFTNMPCGQAQPPRRFPSAATFTRALGPLVPRMIVKCLYGQEINLLSKVSHHRLGLRGVFTARVGSEVGDARPPANPCTARG